MSAWRGLHNPDRHITTTSGRRAMCKWEGQHNHDTWCDPGGLCYCCLAAEVEKQTARAEAAEAKVQRLRELHAAKDCGCCCTHCDNGWPCPTIAALDGGG